MQPIQMEEIFKKYQKKSRKCAIFAEDGQFHGKTGKCDGSEIVN